MNLPKPVVGILFIIALCVFGLMAGGFLGGRFFGPENPTGFDGLSSVLGGAFGGIVVALGLGLWLYFKLSEPVLRKATWGVLAGAVLIVALLFFAAQRAQQEQSTPPERTLTPTGPAAPTAPAPNAPAVPPPAPKNHVGAL